VVFDHQKQEKLADAVLFCLELFKQPKLWKELIKNAMAEEFSWQKSAKSYEQLYHWAIDDNLRDS